MLEEKGLSSANMNDCNGNSESVATDVEEFPFRCPACGGEQLSYGVKSYQKAVIHADGEMEFYGGDSFGEDDVDFACWDCGHVISDNGEPIRRPEEMAKWLKAHGAGKKG